MFNRLERITDAVEKCLSTWRLVLHHQLSVNDTSRFMKMLILCFFSLHNVAEREQGKMIIGVQSFLFCASYLLLHVIVYNHQCAETASHKHGADQYNNTQDTEELH